MAIFTGTIVAPKFEDSVSNWAIFDVTYTCTISLEIKPWQPDDDPIEGYYLIADAAAALSLTAINTFTVNSPPNPPAPNINFDGEVAVWWPPPEGWGDAPIAYTDVLSLKFEQHGGNPFSQQSLEFLGSWNSTHTELSGEIKVSASYEGSTVGQTHVPFTLTGSVIDRHCIYDLNGDGKFTKKNPVVAKQEKAFGDCAERVKTAKQKIADLEKKIPGYQEAIDYIKGQTDLPTIVTGVTLLGTSIKAGLSGVGPVGAAILGGIGLGNIINSVREAFTSNSEVNLRDNWSDL